MVHFKQLNLFFLFFTLSLTILISFGGINETFVIEDQLLLRNNPKFYAPHQQADSGLPGNLTFATYERIVNTTFLTAENTTYPWTIELNELWNFSWIDLSIFHQGVYVCWSYF